MGLMQTDSGPRREDRISGDRLLFTVQLPVAPPSWQNRATSCAIQARISPSPA